MFLNNLFQAPPLQMELTGNERIVPCIWVSLPPGINQLDNADPIDLLKKLEDFPICIPSSSILNPSDDNLKLLPLTNHIEQIQQKPATLVNLTFYNLSIKSKGGAGFSAEVIMNLIKGSLTPATNDSMYAYNQNVVKLSPMPTHQPNFFRPKFVVNGVDYFGGLDQTYDYKDGAGTINKGQFSAGIALPMRHEPAKYYHSVTSIEVYGQCLQILKPDSNTYVAQKYPLVCEAMFAVEA